ncbi:DUF6950 family protein [Caulobacter endophyticus]|uniref:DUF6950 domain-containing protein n=1 Tax=Caulobacter endophyticus TaxID=2172652 RepID=A0A2T9K3Y7_9CAUL|nr:hypothetical protein [Caulobacter endophyticus]PVM90657.1 hypothetical protein DDF67_09505 [Caulobacter endophyticus]
MIHPLDLRVQVAEATRAAFEGHAFAWGHYDCVRLAAFAALGMGYAPRLLRGGFYRTALGARRAIRRTGFASLEAAIDDLGLPRLGWAYALPSDIVALPSGEDWPALGVVMDQNHVLAFSNVDGLCRIARPAPSDIKILWSAPPCLKQP